MKGTHILPHWKDPDVSPPRNGRSRPTFPPSLRAAESGKLVTASSVKYKAEDLAFLTSLAESGQYQAVSDRTHELSEIVEAHRFVDTGRKEGNVILRAVCSA